MSKREEKLLRRLVREALELNEFSVGSFFGGGESPKAVAQAKLRLADLFHDDADVAFDDAEPYIEELEAAGDGAAASFYREKLKKHHKSTRGSVRSKDNPQYMSRMKQIYGRDFVN